MNAALRTQLRTAIDQHARQQRQALIDAGELEVCRQCGGDRENRTAGCDRCSDRHRKWGLRVNPDWLANERDLQRAARARRRSVSFPSRPAGSSLAVGSCKESPVGRTPSPVQLSSATNRRKRG